MDIDASGPEVAGIRRSALDLLLSEHAGDCEAPCTVACPAHARVEEYVRQGKQGQHLEALRIIKERIPLPISISRVCPRFCEQDCRRNVIDKGAPVAINDFKRLAADLYYESYLEELPPLGPKRVAIVGAGPAGLAVAYFLRLHGVGSDLYEKMPKAGGMLRYGIPEFRLPKGLLDKEIAHFEKMGGIAFFFGNELGENLSIEDLKQRYDAIAVTVGSWSPSSMQTAGEEYAEKGIRWLEKIALADWSGENPGKTVVIGGGNTAMDCVRTAVRLGSSEVICCYRRSEHEMPAEKIEVEQAKQEGVQFEFLTAPVRLRQEGGRKILTCQKMTLGEPDASGRRRPVVIDGSEFDLAADTVISAIGQKTVLPHGVKSDRWGNVAVDNDDYSVEAKIFAAGDCVSGPASVVEAVAAGRIVALGIVNSFQGKKYQRVYEINVSRGHWGSLSPEQLVFLNDHDPVKRVAPRFLSIENRKSSFAEVSLTLTREEIAQEGRRCIECSCGAKIHCRLKRHSEEYGADLQRFVGEKRDYGYDRRHPTIIIDCNKCIKCGICVKICKEVVTQSLLGFKQRGYETKLGTAFDAPLPDSCAACGQCVAACPVGALDFRRRS